jgi:hypothetical protein
MNEIVRKPFMPPDRAAVHQRAAANLFRAALADACTTAKRQIPPTEFIKAHWPNDANEIEAIRKAATAPASTNDAAWAVVLTTKLALLAALAPVSAAADLIGRSLKLEFGNSAVISVPTVARPVLHFTGEGKPIAAVAGTVSIATSMEPAKIAGIITMTAEMINGSNAEPLLRQMLVEASALALDTAMFSANAGTADAPPGIFHNVTPIAAAAAGLDAPRKDIAAITGAVARATGGPVVLIVAPEQFTSVPADVRAAIDVLSSAALPARSIAAVSAAALATAVDPPRLDSSKHVLLHSADPASDISTAGSPNVLSAPVKSVYQTDSIAIRLILPATWAMRSAAGVAMITGTNW